VSDRTILGSSLALFVVLCWFSARTIGALDGGNTAADGPGATGPNFTASWPAPATGGIRLTGAVDDITRTLIEWRAESFGAGASVINDLGIIEATADDEWTARGVSLMGAAHSAMPRGSVSFDGARAVVEGTLASAEAKDSLLATLRTIAGSSVTVEDRLRVAPGGSTAAEAPGAGRRGATRESAPSTLASSPPATPASAAPPSPAAPTAATPSIVPRRAPSHPVEQNIARVIGSRAIEFESGSTTLTPDSADILDEVAVALSRAGEVAVEIHGHTDSVGDPAFNDQVSRERASAVRAYLLARGVPAQRLIARGFGPSRPIADNATAEGRRQNRRIEFVVATREPR
jgi:OOP family OmpA-OmpF porin